MQWLKSDTAVFLLKVAGIYLVWYLVYELWLLPDGSLDQWMSENVASVSVGFLQLIGYDAFGTGRMIIIGESPGIYLANGCSGISAMGLFIGFVVAYPGTWIPRLAYICIGMGVIYFVNIARNVTLAITQVYWAEFFDIMHDYSTTAIFYIVIFGLWVFWANYGEAALSNTEEVSPQNA